MARGLGKGLDSLIPNYYDENFDSNGAQSLEDMLNESIEKSTKSETVEKESDIENVSEDTDDNDESRVDEKNVKDDISSSETGGNSEASEEVHSVQGSEDSVPSSQEDEIKKENVAEVLDIVDKNPRITLWSSRSAAVFRYLRKTEPEFSISREASILIDEAVSKKYPDIWKLFEDI